MNLPTLEEHKKQIKKDCLNDSEQACFSWVELEILLDGCYSLGRIHLREELKEGNK